MIRPHVIPCYNFPEMILNINKPQNWTSFDVVAKIKGTKKFKKVGHTGTLDPLATGVLVVVTDTDTKRQDVIMKTNKEYLAEIAFGAFTPTYDLEIEPEFTQSAPKLEHIQNKLPSALTKYIGKIQQTVPPYSAKKVDGKELYKSARKGTINLDNLPTKEVEISSIDLLDIYMKELAGNSIPHAKLKIKCSPGTYIRSLANDLGKDLETKAVLSSLVRTKVGKYSLENSRSLDQVVEGLKNNIHFLSR